MIPWREILHYLMEGGILVFLIGGIRAVNRFANLIRDYPLHRHENGLIVYPPDFEPGKVEKLHAGGNS